MSGGLLRACKPREHGLWAWALVPLLSAVVLQPGVGTLTGALSVVAGFGAANALGLWLRRRDGTAARAAASAGTLAVLFAAVALSKVPSPITLALVFCGGAACGAAILAGTGGRLPRSRWLEVPGLALLVGIASGIALAGGAPAAAVATVGLLQFSWFLIGIWYVDGQLARVIPGRRRWSGGAWFALGASSATLVVSAAAGLALVGLLPLLYPLRVVLHAPVETGRQARRLGLTELCWALAVGVAGSLIARS